MKTNAFWNAASPSSASLRAGFPLLLIAGQTGIWWWARGRGAETCRDELVEKVRGITRLRRVCGSVRHQS